jgi:hypothetical protein
MIEREHVKNQISSFKEPEAYERKIDYGGTYARVIYQTK